MSGRGLCDELITRPEESDRLCCVVVCDLEKSRIGAPYIYNVRLLTVKDRPFAVATLRCVISQKGADIIRIAAEDLNQQ